MTLQEITTWIAIGAMAYVVAVFMPERDMEAETDFIEHEKPTVTVFIKQINGVNPLVFKGCVLLGSQVEC
jgi:hypothetical protein